MYQTTITNTHGIAGHITFSDHSPLETKHPLTDGDGLNPEQLLGAAWATCLNATIQALLEAKKMNLRSKVDVTVTLYKEVEQVGYYFDVCATASIEQLPLLEAEKIITAAHNRCPVSKLLQGARNLQLKTIPYQTWRHRK